MGEFDAAPGHPNLSESAHDQARSEDLYDLLAQMLGHSIPGDTWENDEGGRPIDTSQLGMPQFPVPIRQAAESYPSIPYPGVSPNTRFSPHPRGGVYRDVDAQFPRAEHTDSGVRYLWDANDFRPWGSPPDPNAEQRWVDLEKPHGYGRGSVPVAPDTGHPLQAGALQSDINRQVKEMEPMSFYGGGPPSQGPGSDPQMGGPELIEAIAQWLASQQQGPAQQNAPSQMHRYMAAHPEMFSYTAERHSPYWGGPNYNRPNDPSMMGILEKGPVRESGGGTASVDTYSANPNFVPVPPGADNPSWSYAPGVDADSAYQIAAEGDYLSQLAPQREAFAPDEAPFGRFGGEENGRQGYYAPRGNFIPTSPPQEFGGSPFAAEGMQGLTPQQPEIDTFPTEQMGAGEVLMEATRAPQSKPKKGKNSEFFALLTKMKQEDKEGKKDTRKALSSLAKQLQSESATENPSNASGTISV